MRKIVFIGNCQCRIYHNLYVDNFARRLGDAVSFVPSFYFPAPSVLDLVADADVVVAQVFDTDAAFGLHNGPTNARRVLFPNVTGMFLWPTGGVSHPLNKKDEYLPFGPYDVDWGDRWLNRKLNGGELSDREVDAIVEEYLALDLASTAMVGSKYDLLIDLQRERDEATGFACASIIESQFQHTKLFHNPSSCQLPIVRHVAGTMFRELGASAADVASMLDDMPTTPFLHTDRPIHPSVIRFFGLSYVSEDTRYRALTGEWLDLREYVRRYLRYDWNVALWDAWLKADRVPYDAREEDVREAVARLEQALKRSLACAGPERALSRLYGLLGDKANEFAAFLRSMRFDDGIPNAVSHFSSLMAGIGRPREARQLLIEATRRWPKETGLWDRLIQRAVLDDQPRDALKYAAQAVATCPGHQPLMDVYESLRSRLPEET
jgi:hypothetical protein